jgi:hypothetical protein
VVEYLPWNEGKRSLATVMMGFLARWGRRLSWREDGRGLSDQLGGGPYTPGVGHFGHTYWRTY